MSIPWSPRERSECQEGRYGYYPRVAEEHDGVGGWLEGDGSPDQDARVWLEGNGSPDQDARVWLEGNGSRYENVEGAKRTD